MCDRCTYYSPVRARVAIVKLGAMGDVLRTTALLNDILQRHPQSEIFWITQPESAPLLRGIDGISHVLEYPSAMIVAQVASFDVLYSLDNADEGVALADSLSANIKRGFRRGDSGHCEGVYDGGDPTLFELGLWDDLKRQNKSSYLRLLAASAGLTYSGGPPQIKLGKEELERAAAEFEAIKRPTIGINTDAGTRWLRKQWNLPYVEQAAQSFVAKGYGVVLFGGKAVEAFNDSMARRFPTAVRVAKTHTNVRDLLAAIAQVDLVLTGDTLAMHAAWALGVPIVALFGPTSAAEIDLDAEDIKMYAEQLECLGCYLHTCNVAPHCMDLLSPGLVVQAVEKRLQAANSLVAR